MLRIEHELYNTLIKEIPEISKSLKSISENLKSINNNLKTEKNEQTINLRKSI